MSGAGPSGRALSVLLVHERFPPDYGGGGEYVVLQLAKHLIAAGHRVRVLTTGNPADDRFEGVRLQRLPISRYRLNFAVAEIAAAAAAADADLIHCFSYQSACPSWLAGRRTGKPVVLGVLALFGATWRAVRGPVRGRLYEGFERLVMRLPFAARFFLSPGSLALAQHLGLGRPGDCVIAPGISLEDYAPAARKEGVLFAGKLEARKGIGTVQDLARALPHIPFRVIGWGPEFDAIRSASPPNLAVEPFTDRRQLAGALGAARIFLFPSQAETFGLAVAEAMASGCAIVGAAPMEFSGARVDPGDAAAIRVALARLWDDPAECERLGAANQLLARQYNWPRHVEALEQRYAEVLAGSSPATTTTKHGSLAP